MSFPKWKYRKHPTLGVFQSTLVADEAAESTLEADWSDDAATTGFAMRPASQINPAHNTSSPLYEVITDAEGVAKEAVTEAAIAMTTTGDIQNG